MNQYKVVACWYETACVEAKNEDEALAKAFSELSPDIQRNGTVDDWVIDAVDGGADNGID